MFPEVQFLEAKKIRFRINMRFKPKQTSTQETHWDKKYFAMHYASISNAFVLWWRLIPFDATHMYQYIRRLCCIQKLMLDCYLLLLLLLITIYIFAIKIFAFFDIGWVLGQGYLTTLNGFDIIRIYIPCKNLSCLSKTTLLSI